VCRGRVQEENLGGGGRWSIATKPLPRHNATAVVDRFTQLLPALEV